MCAYPTKGFIENITWAGMVFNDADEVLSDSFDVDSLSILFL